MIGGGRVTEYFNQSTEKDNRRDLRKSMPEVEVLLWARLKGRQLLGSHGPPFERRRTR